MTGLCEECLGETGEELHTCGCDINEDQTYCDPNATFGTITEEQFCWLLPICFEPEDADNECLNTCAA